MLRKISIIIAAVAVLLLSGCGAKTISTAGMLDVQFIGMNEKGSIGVLDINKDKLVEALKVANISSQEAFEVYQGIKLNADKMDNLSNGDVVTITLSVDKTVADKFKINIKSTNEKITVNGLVDAIPISEMLKIEYKGFSPRASIRASLDIDKFNTSLGSLGFSDGQIDSIRKTIKIAPSKTKDIANGDVIKFSVEYDKSVSDKTGIKINPIIDDSTVSGLSDTMNINDLLLVNYRGISPDISIDVTVNYSEYKTMMSAMGFSDNEMRSLYNSFIITPSKTKELSNGETVDITMKYDSDIASKFSFKINSNIESINLAGHSEYISSSEQLTTEMINNLNRSVFKKLRSTHPSEAAQLNKDFLFVETFYVNDVVEEAAYSFSSPRKFNGIVYVFENLSPPNENQKYIAISIAKPHTQMLLNEDLIYITYEDFKMKTKIDTMKKSSTCVNLPVEFSFNEFM